MNVIPRAMSSLNPILVDRCLRKCIGQEFCKPIKNGNLLVKCVNLQQTDTI